MYFSRSGEATTSTTAPLPRLASGKSSTFLEDLSTISIDELVGSLQAQEQQMNQYDDTSHLEKALYSKVAINDNPSSKSYVRGRGEFEGGYQGGRGRGRQPFNKRLENEGYHPSGYCQNFRGRGRGRF